MSYFDDAFNFLIDNEVRKGDTTGGYTNDPSDSGGETKWGISKNANPRIDIKNLTKDQAMLIYKNNYWKPEYDLLKNKDLAIRVFDMAVNSGSDDAERTLQRAINACGGNVITDGEIGALTIAAANSIHAGWILERFRVERSKFYADDVNRSPPKIKYLKGWIWRNYR
jgi:lysozyme family protein